MKINYTVDANGFHIQGVDQTNPVVYLNDFIKDTPDAFYLFLKANCKEVNLVGVISDHNGHPASTQPGSNPNEKQPALFAAFNELYNSFKNAGCQNVPAPILGSTKNMTNGQTAWENSAGADLIIAEAKKASASKPLILFIGGQATTAANAYLKDKSIKDNIVVLHVDSIGKTNFNAIDSWAVNVLIEGGVALINWDGDANSWYDEAGSPQYRGSWNPPIKRMPGITFANINNGFHNMYKSNFAHMYDAFGSIGDGPVVFWFFNHSLWQNVIRKNKQNQTVTTDDYAFLLVSKNNWTQYGPQLSAYMNNPTNYIPVTTPLPNQPPSVAITSGNNFTPGPVNLTAIASDDQQVSKVEFFVDGNKIGEDTQGPYVVSWQAIAGTYTITAKATDNQGVATTSAPVTITVSDVVVPPPTGTIDVVAGTTTTLAPGSAATVAKDQASTPEKAIFNFGIPQGIPGPSSGGGVISLGRGYADVREHGATGSGADDAIGFQKAWDSLKGTGGQVHVPYPDNFYNFKTTFNAIPDGSNQAWTDVRCVNMRAGKIRYTGPGNQPAIRIIGLKGALWEGLHLAIEDGRSGCQAVDIDSTQNAGSTSFVTFKSCYMNLGNGQNNAGFRLGHNSGGGADISNYQWENCIVFGGGKLGSSGLVEAIPGQIAYHVEGNNTLSQTWIGGFVAGCDRIFSNKNGAGAKVDRGNGSVFFYGLGSSQNNIDYDINFEQNYLIIGGRYESSNSILTTATHSFHAAITFQDIQFNDYKSDHLFDVNTAATLYIKNCRMNKKSGALNDLVRCSAQAGAGTITIESGGTNAVNLIRQDGGGTFKKYVRGVGKFSDVNGVFIGSHYPDQNGN